MIFSTLDTLEDFGIAGCPPRAGPLSFQSPPGVTYLGSFWMPLSQCHRLLCLCGSFPECLIPPSLKKIIQLCLKDK